MVESNITPPTQKKRKDSLKEKIVLFFKVMNRSRMFKIFVLVLILNIAWAGIYSYLEDIPFYLALYWATDTLTNTGSGLVPPSHFITWFLTTILMWVGLGVTLLFVNNVYGNLMKKERIEVKFENHIVLLGWSQKMRHFLHNISGLGVHHDYVLVADLAERPYGIPEIVKFIPGNPTEERVLNAAGIKKADQAIIVMEDDSDAVLGSMTIQELNPNVKLSVNLINGENVKHLQRIGVEEIICDEHLTGNALIDSFYRNKKQVNVEE